MDLDPQVVNLAKSIRQVESGGNYNASGKSGEHGGYQFTEDTWNAAAPKYGIKVPLKQATPEQQNAVVYNRIKAWKDSGKDVTQIASMWNAGEGEPDAYTGKFGSSTGSHKAGDPSIGVNKFGAKYDVPAYAKSVASAYLKIKNGQEVGTDPSNPSSVTGRKTFSDSIKEIPQQAPQGGTDSIPSVMGDIKKGDYLGAASDAVRKFGSAMTFGTSEGLGKEIGEGGAYLGEKIKGFLGGDDNSKYVDTSDITLGNTIKNVAGVGGSIAGLAMIPGAVSTIADLAIPKEVAYNIPMEMSEFKALGTTERLNVLGKALADPETELGDATKIAQYVKKLQPGEGFLSKLLKGGMSMAKYEILRRVLGDTVGGLIHRSTGN